MFDKIVVKNNNNRKIILIILITEMIKKNFKALKRLKLYMERMRCKKLLLKTGGIFKLLINEPSTVLVILNKK